MPVKAQKKTGGTSRAESKLLRPNGLAYGCERPNSTTSSIMRRRLLRHSACEKSCPTLRQLLENAASGKLGQDSNFRAARVFRQLVGERIAVHVEQRAARKRTNARGVFRPELIRVVQSEAGAARSTEGASTEVEVWLRKPRNSTNLPSSLTADRRPGIELSRRCESTPSRGAQGQLGNRVAGPPAILRDDGKANAQAGVSEPVGDERRNDDQLEVNLINAAGSPRPAGPPAGLFAHQ